MKIIISGCGKIGTAIVKSLSKDTDNEITVIDPNQNLLNELVNTFDIQIVAGSGADKQTLESADIKNTDLFIAVTMSDELNMLSCFLASSLGAAHTVARVRNPEYNQNSLPYVQQKLNISFPINPEKLTAEELYNILKFPSAMKIETFYHHTFQMVEYRLPETSRIAGLSLMEMRNRFNTAKYLVCVVQRGDDVYIPGGQFVLQAGDRLGVAATPDELRKLFKALGILQKQAKDVMILGGSRTAYYLSELLVETGGNVKLVERDHETAVRFSDTLPKVDVVEGDAAHYEFLLDEGLKSMDALVALTGMDEQNILMSLFASNAGVKSLAKVSREESYAMAEKMLDCTVSPQRLIVDALGRYARALQATKDSSVETLYNLMDDKAVALEFKVLTDFPRKKVPLKELHLKPNILVAGIVRNRKPIIPTGADYIDEGDHVIVIASGQNIVNLSDILDK